LCANRSLTALYPLRARLYQPETPIMLRERRLGQRVEEGQGDQGFMLPGPLRPVHAREIARNAYRRTSSAKRRDCAGETNEAIAELRELYRLVRMFPFDQYKARNTLADQLTSQLKGWCQSQDLPDAGVDWRMQKPNFERLLRQIAEARRVASVDEALNVLHVNHLHDKWLRLARERVSTSESGRCHSLNSTWHGC
jgi:hypothetical protein